MCEVFQGLKTGIGQQLSRMEMCPHFCSADVEVLPSCLCLVSLFHRVVP